MSDFDGLELETPLRDLLALEELANRACAGREDPVIVEVGSWVGRTALVMAKAVPNAKIFCVDTWKGTANDVTVDLAKKHGFKVFETFCANVGSRLFDSIIPLKGESWEWARVFPSRGADLVFIDADHNYHTVRQDIRAWRQKVRQGGILCGHDYFVYEGVTKGVDEELGRGAVQVGGFCIWSQDVVN